MIQIHTHKFPIKNSFPNNVLPNDHNTPQQDQHPRVPSSPHFRRSTRQTNPLTKLIVYILYNVTEHDHHFNDCLHTITNFFINNDEFCHHAVNQTQLLAFTVNSKIFEPLYYHQSKGKHLWEEAMQKEYVALVANNT